MISGKLYIFYILCLQNVMFVSGGGIVNFCNNSFVKIK